MRLVSRRSVGWLGARGSDHKQRSLGKFKEILETTTIDNSRILYRLVWSTRSQVPSENEMFKGSGISNLLSGASSMALGRALYGV